jgi:hypothetical protein
MGSKAFLPVKSDMLGNVKVQKPQAARLPTNKN